MKKIYFMAMIGLMTFSSFADDIRLGIPDNSCPTGSASASLSPDAESLTSLIINKMNTINGDTFDEGDWGAELKNITCDKKEKKCIVDILLTGPYETFKKSKMINDRFRSNLLSISVELKTPQYATSCQLSFDSLQSINQNFYKFEFSIQQCQNELVQLLKKSHNK